MRDMTDEERERAETGFGFGPAAVTDERGTREVVFGSQAEPEPDLLAPFSGKDVVEALREEAHRISTFQAARVAAGRQAEPDARQMRRARGMDTAALIIELLIQTENWPEVRDALGRAKKGYGPRQTWGRGR